jgi:hypothetical protein
VSPETLGKDLLGLVDDDEDGTPAPEVEEAMKKFLKKEDLGPFSEKFARKGITTVALLTQPWLRNAEKFLVDKVVIKVVLEVVVEVVLIFLCAIQYWQGKLGFFDKTNNKACSQHYFCFFSRCLTTTTPTHPPIRLACRCLR